MSNFIVPKDRKVMIQYVEDDLTIMGVAEYNAELTMFYDFTNKYFICEEHVIGWSELIKWNVRG